MKLYYAPGTCSLAPHIVAREAGLDVALERVDLAASPRRTESGTDFSRISPGGYVPALGLDDGEILLEGVVIVQYLADLAPTTGLAPAAETRERYRLQQWLHFVATELHKMFSPWLFHPEYGTQAAEVARTRIGKRLAVLDARLAGRRHLLGQDFTVADAYAFTIVRWAPQKGIDLAPFPHLAGYLERVAARPAVRDALAAEGPEVAA